MVKEGEFWSFKVYEINFINDYLSITDTGNTVAAYIMNVEDDKYLLVIDGEVRETMLCFNNDVGKGLCFDSKIFYKPVAKLEKEDFEC